MRGKRRPARSATVKAWIAAVCLLVRRGAWAGPQQLVVGRGDCTNLTLAKTMGFMAEALQLRGGNVLDGDEATKQLFPKPPRTLQEIEGQLEAATNLFYTEDKVDQSLRLTNIVLSEISQLSPEGGEAWELAKKARLFQTLVQVATEEKKKADSQADDPLREIARVEPEAVLGPKYPKEVIQRFNEIRKEMAGSKKSTLTITSEPPGADVYLEGHLSGKTPFKRSMAVGRYQLLLKLGDARSFIRTMEVVPEAPTTLSVDLAYEGRFRSSTGLCFGEDKNPIGTASRLAGRLNVQHNIQQVILLSLSHEGNELTAELVDVVELRRVRSGSVPLTSSTHRTKEVDGLAYFILTGNETANVIVGSVPASTETPSGPPAAPAEPASLGEVAGWSGVGIGLIGAAVAYSQVLQSPAAFFPVATDSGGESTRKVISQVMLGGATVLVGAATIFMITHSLVPRFNHRRVLLGDLRLGVTPTQQGFAFSVGGTLP